MMRARSTDIGSLLNEGAKHRGRPGIPFPRRSDWTAPFVDLHACPGTPVLGRGTRRSAPGNELQTWLVQLVQLVQLVELPLCVRVFPSDDPGDPRCHQRGASAPSCLVSRATGMVGQSIDGFTGRTGFASVQPMAHEAASGYHTPRERLQVCSFLEFSEGSGLVLHPFLHPFSPGMVWCRGRQ
jgi:hypothetical protein